MVKTNPPEKVSVLASTNFLSIKDDKDIYNYVR